MSGSLGQAAMVSPGVMPGGGVPGGAPLDMPQGRLPGALGTPGGGGTPGAGAVNALAPAGPQAAPGPGMSAGMPGSLDAVSDILSKDHGRAKAAYEQTTKALSQIDAIRKGLELLSDKGDMVVMEDVIEEASKLVGHGIDPSALAGLLADAPQEGGGEALGGWVATHAMTAAAAEQQLLVMHSAARHQMGVSSLRMIMSHTVGQAIMPTPDEQAATDNQLMPGKGGPPPTSDVSMAGAKGVRFMEPQ